MMRRSTLGGWHWSPFLYAIAKKFPTQVSLDNYNRTPLSLTTGGATLKITNIGRGYKFESGDDESTVLLQCLMATNRLNGEGFLPIRQDPNGLDLEDRVEKCTNLIHALQHGF